MSFYNGLTFFIVLVLGCMPAVVLGLKEKRIGNYTLAFSLVLIFAIYRMTPGELFYLILYVFFIWHLIVLYQYSLRRFGKIKAIYFHTLLFALLPLAAAKAGGVIGRHWFSFLGISYITFKVLQIILESFDGLIEKSSFMPTLTFLLFFPSLSSGPIDRSRRFESDFQKNWSREEYVALLQKGIWKLLLGILYKFVLSAIAYDFLEKINDCYAPQFLLPYAYLYGIYMFFDFAGYSLMAVGTSYIFGIRIPDNFNKPFISRDVKEFWNRWHITLSHWLRDFLFSRYVTDSIRKKRFKNRMDAASAGFMVNMLVMGAWHGLTKDYLLYGLYHGVLLAVTDRYQKKKWYRKVRNKRWYQFVSWFFTMNLIMLGFLIFSGRFFQAVRIWMNYI